MLTNFLKRVVEIILQLLLHHCELDKHKWKTLRMNHAADHLFLICTVLTKISMPWEKHSTLKNNAKRSLHAAIVPGTILHFWYRFIKVCN